MLVEGRRVAAQGLAWFDGGLGAEVFCLDGGWVGTPAEGRAWGSVRGALVQPMRGQERSSGSVTVPGCSRARSMAVQR